MAVCLLAASSLVRPTILHPELKLWKCCSLHCCNGWDNSPIFSWTLWPGDERLWWRHHALRGRRALLHSPFRAQWPEGRQWMLERQWQHVSTAARWNCSVDITKPYFLCPYQQVLKCEAISFFFFWRIIALQNFVVFCQPSTWISHRYTHVPSLLNCPPISLPIPLL